jgi:hypothetical protein
VSKADPGYSSGRCSSGCAGDCWGTRLARGFDDPEGRCLYVGALRFRCRVIYAVVGFVIGWRVRLRMLAEYRISGWGHTESSTRASRDGSDNSTVPRSRRRACSSLAGYRSVSSLPNVAFQVVMDMLTTARRRLRKPAVRIGSRWRRICESLRGNRSIAVHTSLHKSTICALLESWSSRSKLTYLRV